MTLFFRVSPGDTGNTYIENSGRHTFLPNHMASHLRKQ